MQGQKYQVQTKNYFVQTKKYQTYSQNFLVQLENFLVLNHEYLKAIEKFPKEDGKKTKITMKLLTFQKGSLLRLIRRITICVGISHYPLRLNLTWF